WIQQADSNFSILVLTIMFTTSIVILTGLLQLLIGWFRFMPGDDSLYSVFTNRNLFSSALFVFIPFNLYAALSEKKSRIMGNINVGLSILIIILLKSRATWLALLIALLCIITLLLIRKDNIRMLRNILLQKRNLVTAIVILVAVVFGFCFMNSQFLKKTTTVGRKDIVSTGTLKLRFQAWDKSWQMLKDKPVLGHGAGNWRLLLPKYELGKIKREGKLFHWNRPHNDFLWVAAETGVIGGLAYISIFVMILFLGVRVLLREKEPDRAVLMLLTICGIVGYLGIALFSFPRERIVQYMMIHVLFAVILSMDKPLVFAREANPKKHRAGESKPFSTIAVGCVLISLFVTFIGIYRDMADRKVVKIGHAHAEYSRILNGYQAKKIPANIAGPRLKEKHETIERIVDRLNPNLYNVDGFGKATRSYLAELYMMQDRYALAISEFQKSLKATPYDSSVLNNLAVAYWRSGKFGEALQTYEYLFAIASDLDLIRLNMIAIQWLSKQPENAYKTLAELEEPLKDATRLQVFNEMAKYYLERGDSTRVKIVLEKISPEIFTAQTDSIKVQLKW
ncbi:MAG: O-antigen ligase family protein, partial [Candidatus Cloacimonetes bacterium]|nr:O-antigen ligase family protein [Candidatus Cloacimonadota bacterium]